MFRNGIYIEKGEDKAALNIIWFLIFHNISLDDFDIDKTTDKDLIVLLSPKVKSILDEKPKIEYLKEAPVSVKMTFSFLTKMNFILSNEMEKRTLQMLEDRFQLYIGNIKRTDEKCKITLGPMTIH